MNNIMTIEGHKAVIQFDPEIKMFRGEFSGLSGGADFYADSVEGLYKEGAVSLRLYLDACREEGIEPYKSFSGRLTLRLNEELHEAAALAAKAEHKSLNQWIERSLKSAAAESGFWQASAREKISGARLKAQRSSCGTARKANGSA